ncbi:MAG: peptidylprolyl isomerase, partial [Flavobacteriaceae bacterium]|nr:peptidylprolyl isomerase [Flavobacteriaceae bacterium]
MAILSKIRDHSIFLIIIIALALFSFVIGDIFTKGSFGSNKNSVGEINGENIGREEFAQLVEQIRARSGNRASMIQSVNAAWDNLVREKIYQSQLQKSGIVVGEKDVWDEIVNQLSSQGNPQFMNEAGIFDPEKFKDYIAGLKDNQDAGEQDKLAWLSWLNYERSVKSNMEIQTYNNLINAGLNATLKEGERYYTNANTKLNIDYVFVPYNSIPDSLVTVSDDEIKDYVKQHPDEYKSEPSIDISFVKFDIKATPEDEAAIEKQLAGLINNKEEYSTAAKSTITVEGLASTNNIEDFFRENSSDTPLDNEYHFKKDLNKDVADTIFKMEIGQVYGPYKDGDYLKITRLMDVKQMPDSVKARHILIPFQGAMGANPSGARTEEQASKLADSLLTVLKSDKSKFETFVNEYSSDQGSISKGGKYDWYPYNRMVPEFRDFTFEGKTGDMGVVKTAYGFHIIEIEGQKGFQKAVRLATFTRKITASEETENTIYQKAETFASELSNGKDITDLAKENGLTVQPVVGLKAMDERVSTLGD